MRPLLSLLPLVRAEELSFVPYAAMSLKDQIKLSLIQRDYYEEMGMLPKDNVYDDSGNLIYSPSIWVDRQLPEEKVRKLAATSTMTLCPDGVTQCDSSSTTCFGCFCYIQPFSQTILGRPSWVPTVTVSGRIASAAVCRGNSLASDIYFCA